MAKTTSIRVHRPTGERYILDGLVGGLVSDQIEVSIHRDGEEVEHRLIDENGHFASNGRLYAESETGLRRTAKIMAGQYSGRVEAHIAVLGRMHAGEHNPSDASTLGSPTGRREVAVWTARDLGL